MQGRTLTLDQVRDLLHDFVQRLAARGDSGDVLKDQAVERVKFCLAQQQSVGR
jgi:hypothetical protein